MSDPAPTGARLDSEKCGGDSAGPAAADEEVQNTTPSPFRGEDQRRVKPTGQWSDPMTCGAMKASRTLGTKSSVTKK